MITNKGDDMFNFNSKKVKKRISTVIIIIVVLAMVVPTILSVLI